MSSENKTASIASNDKLAASEKDFSEQHYSDDETLIETKSIGVEKAEILAKQYEAWYYKVILLISAFLVGYAYGLDGQVRGVLTGYATDSYLAHSLLSTISVITAFVGAGFQPVYARLADLFGRLELFIVSILFYVVGTIIECQAVDVQKYAAGSIFYQIGYTGAIIVVLFIVSDFSSLKWRLFYSFVPAFPFIINTWISGNVVSAVGMNWKWGIGMWAFIYPLACIPLVCCMIHMRIKAGKTEEWKAFKQRKTKFQELGFKGFAKYIFWNLDIIGLLLFLVGIGCLLIPFTLASSVTTAGQLHSKWKSGSILAPIVVGVFLLPVFLIWEGRFAKNPLIPVFLLKDRGIWSASIIAFLLNCISSIESNFIYAVLLIAINESSTSATRISSLASFVSTLAGIFVGLFMVYFRRLKGLIITGCCLWLVAFGLLYHFRAGESSHSGIIGGFVVLGLGTVCFTYPIVVSVQTCVSHEHMAIAVSFIYTLYRIGASFGSAIAGAIWTQTLFKEIVKHGVSLSTATFAYQQPYQFVAQNPWGTKTREGVVAGYKYVQRIFMIVCLVLCVPMILATFLLRDHKLTNDQSLEQVEEEQQHESLSDFIRNALKGGKPKEVKNKESTQVSNV